MLSNNAYLGKQKAHKMETMKHTGFDMFFSNLSNSKAKRLVLALNNMKRTMHGQTITFKLNRNHPRYLQHQANCQVITTRYKGVTCNAADLMLGLTANRKIGENFAKLSGSMYEGSEFYAEDCNIENISKDIDTLVKEFEETA